ncbi:MAG: DUF2809 domain-containing protein [Chitinispirillaceae bacterium]
MSPNRLLFLTLLCLSVISGLLVRKYASLFPDWTNLVLGDILWAAAVFFFLRFLFPKLSLLTAGTSVLLFCFAVEISQLYQSEWINAIRNTTLGGLLLGFGFLWSDLFAYTVGVVFGMFVEMTAERVRVLGF